MMSKLSMLFSVIFFGLIYVGAVLGNPLVYGVVMIIAWASILLAFTCYIPAVRSRFAVFAASRIGWQREAALDMVVVALLVYAGFTGEKFADLTIFTAVMYFAHNLIYIRMFLTAGLKEDTIS